MAHTIFNSERMSGTFDPTCLVNLKIATDLDNGSIVVIGDQATNENDAFDANKPAVNSDLASLAIIGNPEVMYDERLKSLGDFYNKAGAIVRGYLLRHGNEFSLTANGFTGMAETTDVPKVGQIVELEVGYKLKVVDELTEGSTQVGKIVATRGNYFIVRVI